MTQYCKRPQRHTYILVDSKVQCWEMSSWNNNHSMKDESHPILQLLPFLKTIGMNWNRSTSAKQLLRSQPKEISEQTNVVLSNIETNLFFF